jgi:hypothetical protein
VPCLNLSHPVSSQCIRIHIPCLPLALAGAYFTHILVTPHPIMVHKFTSNYPLHHCHLLPPPLIALVSWMSL